MFPWKFNPVLKIVHFELLDTSKGHFSSFYQFEIKRPKTKNSNPIFVAITKAAIVITPIPLQLAIIPMRMPSIVFVFKHAIGHQGNSSKPLQKLTLRYRLCVIFL